MTVYLSTERLVLRPLAPEDFEEHAEMMADGRIANYLSLDRKPQSRESAWRAFASMLGHWQLRGFGFFSVFDAESNEWLGRVGPWMPEGWPGVECGWGIAPRHWGKGYAPEAAIACIQWIFGRKTDLSRIISLIDPDNANSRKVAAKIGEAETGETFQLEDFTLDVWAADRETWLKRFA